MTEIRTHIESCDTCQRAYERFREERASFTESASRGVVAPGPCAEVTETESGGPDGGVPAGAARHYPTIEGYRILDVLGQGGMGIVYRAVQRKLDRSVALKVLPAMLGSASPSTVARFRREATAAARLHHTNIIPIYDFGESRDAYYFAMELITGQPLNVVIRRMADQNAASAPATRVAEMLHSAILGTPPATAAHDFDPPSYQDLSGNFSTSTSSRARAYYHQVVKWMMDAADALHYAHGEGIIHRDIKPANLILTGDGRIMIADFGLAKSADDESVTITGSLLGTLRYISPEQAMAKRVRVDHRTDVYSLGATMYELLCFQPAFPGSDEKEILGAIISRDPTPPRKIAHTVPAELETICLKTLEKSADSRYPSARAMAEDLRRYIHDLPILAKRPGFAARTIKFIKRHKVPAIGITAIVLLAGTTTITIREQRERRAAEYTSLCDKGRTITGEEYTKRWADAAIQFRKAIKLDGSKSLARVLLAWAKIEQFKAQPELATHQALDEVDELCQRILEDHPGDLNTLNYRSIVLKKLKRYPEAIAVAREITEQTPDVFAAWSNLGAYHALVRNLDEAEKCLRKGVDLLAKAEGVGPGYIATVWRNLASLELHLGRPDALEHAEEATHADSEDVPSWVLLVRARLQLGGSRNVKVALDDAKYVDRAEAGRRNPTGKRMLALAYLRNSELARSREDESDLVREAIRHANVAIDLDDVSAINHLIIAIAEAKRGNSFGARDALNDAEAEWPQELKQRAFIASYDEGVLWFESAAELNSLRDEAEKTLTNAVSKPP